MPLTSGQRIGTYAIASPLGAGGMGEVYRAHDSKLGRDVALKVLPEAFARDAERMARFQREAKVLASLNHPNIASIYGLEDSGSTHALVMELVEGPTLADRIKAGPIPIDEALRIARQICDALEYAHERGIVHRDLKPANVKVTKDDAVKVLDFGLAKAVEGDAASVDILTSPTMSRMATLAGVLLGTAAYMSPEQAKGKPVDRRADIWAFGCVLYEMLTDKMTFTGETVSDTLAAVIRAEPEWSRLPVGTPMRVRVLLQRCLQKDPKQRLRDIGDARIALDEVIAGAPEADLPAGPTRAKTRRLSLVMGLAGLAIGAAIAGFAAWNLKPSPAGGKPVTRFTITLPPGQRLAGFPQQALALSRDGTELAYVATGDVGRPRIYLRAMDTAEVKPVPGTEGGVSPFFSPDDQWLGFFSDGILRKIPVSGGVSQGLTGAGAAPGGATWSSRHTIIFAPVVSPLQEVSDSGGPPRQVSRIEDGENEHAWPELLPGGRAVVFVGSPPPALILQRLDTGERRNLTQGQTGTMPRYMRSGHLVYVQGGNIMAVPFDLGRLEISGTAVPVIQGVIQAGSILAGAQYSVSDGGSLVYLSGTVSGAQASLVWVSRNGKEQPLGAPAGSYDQPRLSPDGRRIAVDVTDNTGSQQVSLYDIARATLSRFTFEGTFNQYPAWTPDGKSVAFTSNKTGAMRIFWQAADGSGGLEPLTDTMTVDVPFSWSPDGRTMAFIGVREAGAKVWILNLDDHSPGAVSGRKAQPFEQGRGFEDAPQFSPDGHWLAYTSDESGRQEVYVRPYPGPGGKWQISTEGGTEPLWNHNDQELFYRAGEKMMAVDINTQAGFVAGKPRQLFEGHYLLNPIGNARANYDVAADGQRFLMIKSLEQGQAAPTQINVVLNWTEELKRLAPTDKK
jgi:eukaryotic-like serine/threonine-protein kinase